MYNPETDCIDVSLDENIRISFNCQKRNASVRLEEPSDIAYLTRLAREEPGLYAKLTCKGMLRRWGSLINRSPLIPTNYCFISINFTLGI